MTLTTSAEAEALQRGSHVRYDADLYGWALEQAVLLKTGRFDQLDIANIADEIADVASRQYEALESDLARVIQHLLKWDVQQERRSRSWVNTILEHRRRVEKRIAENPSLNRRRDEVLAEAFKRGRADALIETDAPSTSFPTLNPLSWDDVMNRPITWPVP